MNLKPIMLFIAFMGLVLYFAMNCSLIKDQAFQWVDKNPKSPDAPEILMRAGLWCSWTGGTQEAQQLFRAIWERYPEARPFSARALYEFAYIYSQGTARRNANPYLERIFSEYEDQEKWRAKARELWDEVNHAL